MPAYPYTTIADSYIAAGTMNRQALQVKARRVNHEAQIEIRLESTPNRGKRTSSMRHSLVLDAEAARELALAICPELAPK